MKNLGISRLIHTFAADETDNYNGCSRHDGYHKCYCTEQQGYCASVYSNRAPATTGGNHAGTTCLRAEWESHEKVYGRWAEAFGMAINERETPEIWKLVETSLATTDPMRKEPKAAYQRLRPFEYYDDTMPSHEEPFLRGEGSFPSGHSLRGWTLTMLLAQIAPERAAAIYRRGREYCDSRVIVGAHWQSDVDAGRNYACVGYIALQNNEAFQKQMRKAKEEYRRVKSEE